MTLKTLAFAFALTGIAANLYARMRHNQSRGRSGTLSLGTGREGAVGRQGGLSDVDAESRSEPDRFRESPLTAVSPGRSGLAAPSQGQAQQQGQQQASSLASPGLPEFTRGA